MDEQQRRVVTLLEKMLGDAKGSLDGMKQAMKDCESRIEGYQIKIMAYSAAVKALSDEIAEWGKNE